MRFYRYCVYASRLLSVAARAIDKLASLCADYSLFGSVTKRANCDSKASNYKRQKPRVAIGKPNQSSVSVAPWLKEASERLSRNGFPATAQLINATKPEPEREDYDFNALASPGAAAAFTSNASIALRSL